MSGWCEMARHRFDPVELDHAVFTVVQYGGPVVTYVIRNSLAMFPGRPYHMRGLETRHVLTACKRLEKAGRIARDPQASWAVMIAWRLPPAAVPPV